MKEQILAALAHSRAGFSELRVRRVWSSSVLVRGRAVDAATTTVETGGLARCCSPGTGWGAVGFAGASRLDASILQAHELSLAGASRRPVRLAPIPIRQLDSAGCPPDDPRETDLGPKQERALAVAGALLDADRRIVASRVMARDEVVETWLATSEGTWIHEVRVHAGIAALAVAEQEGTTERALGSVGSSEGWKSLDAGSLAEAVAARVVERLHARPVRPGRYPVVLDPPAAGALIHRAVAHVARPALPGADPDVLPLGTRLGPEILTIADDPAAPGLPVTAAFDDEGTLTRRCTIVQNGIVLAHVHSRETAGASGQAPTGHARAGSLSGEPYPRASNTFLAPGKGDRDDLLGGIRQGIYLADALACEAGEGGVALRAGTARMIRDGRLAEPVKGVRLGGELLGLFAQVEAVAGDFRWNGGLTRCHDGAAGLVPVTTGAPHLRLAAVEIGSESG